MSIKPRYLIAAPFLLLSAALFVSFLTVLAKRWGGDPATIVLSFVLGSATFFIVGLPGILALKSRWSDFVRVIGGMVFFVLFGFIQPYTRGLEKPVRELVGDDYPLLQAMWMICIFAGPFVICVAAYNRVVPRIVRYIERRNPLPSNTPPDI